METQVVILAPQGRDSQVGTRLLCGHGIDARAVASLDDLATAIRDGVGAVMVAEETLHGSGLDKVSALLDEQDAWSDLPFVILTNGAKGPRTDDEARRLDALGNVVLLPRPLHSEDLLRAVTSALKARRRQYEARDRLAELEEKEASLRASEAQFHAIVNSIDQMIWSTLPDGFHDYYNARWYEYTGVPPGSTDGEAWNGMFHEEDQERAWARWNHSLRTGEDYEIEYRLRHRSGEYRWVFGKAKPVRNDEGEIIRWYGTCTDIHDQVLARQMLAQSREELEQAVDKRTAELIEVRRERELAWDRSLDLLAVVRPDATIQDANPRWKPLLGYDPEDLVGRNFLDLTHPEDVEETRKEFALIFERPLIDPYVFRFLHVDGSYRRFAWTASAYDGLAYPTGRDVTEQHEQAEALAVTEDALRQSQKLETIGQLTGGVAHDFNNLLMAIRSSIELLQRRIPPNDEKSARLMHNAVKATERGAGLTQRMLAFARKQDLNPRPVDIANLVSEMMDLIERSIGPRIEVEMDVHPGLKPAMVDANQLEMAILNLAVNGRDAMDGSGRIFIKLECLETSGTTQLTPGTYVRISVRDEGVGMDAETLSQALEPFFTTKGVGKGTGLGLSMVHGLALQSGGCFELESEPGEGTTACILLPVAKDAALVDPGLAEPFDDAQPADRLRILAVDDDALVLFGTVAMLEEFGHEVIEAGSGAEALEALADESIQIVVTDQAMPQMTGIELAREIHRVRPGLPIILATGYSEMPEGAGDDIALRLEKPFNAKALSRALRDARAFMKVRT